MRFLLPIHIAVCCTAIFPLKRDEGRFLWVGQVFRSIYATFLLRPFSLHVYVFAEQDHCSILRRPVPFREKLGKPRHNVHLPAARARRTIFFSIRVLAVPL